MDRIDYLKEKKYKMQGQLNSLYSNNGDIGQIQKVKSQINEINFEINSKKGNEISQNNQINKENLSALLNKECTYRIHNSTGKGCAYYE